jgi:hypothetical protein
MVKNCSCFYGNRSFGTVFTRARIFASYFETDYSSFTLVPCSIEPFQYYITVLAVRPRWVKFDIEDLRLVHFVKIGAVEAITLLWGVNEGFPHFIYFSSYLHKIRHIRLTQSCTE